jgi:uncharacterized membrane protein
MKERLTICLAIAIALAFMAALNTAQGQDYYIYTVHVRSDGSAVWTITQFSDIDAATTSWDNYQHKIIGVVDEASKITNRAMSVDEGSIELSTTMSSESKITEYSFVWLNFSVFEGDELVLGDVFQVDDFFGKLFGDASLELTYPEGYAPQSLYPPPYHRQDDLDLMKWARTQDLATSNVQIVLASAQKSDGGLEISLSFVGLAIVVVAVPICIGGFIVLRKHRKSSNQQCTKVTPPSAIESDEDKILELLTASGGTMRQTEITERLGFSKAKTSQLLTALENNGVLARYKKGRDKIVTFKKGETANG